MSGGDGAGENLCPRACTLSEMHGMDITCQLQFLTLLICSASGSAVLLLCFGSAGTGTAGSGQYNIHPWARGAAV